MRRRWRWRALSGIAVVGTTLLTGASIFTSAASATPAAPAGAAAPQGVVHTYPEKGTPAFPTKTSSLETVRQLVQCGGTMYAVGTFTQVNWNGTTYRRNNIFSFSASSPFTITKWHPYVNGTVNSIALTNTCAYAYIGGSFSKVDGTTVSNIAKISTTSGNVSASWQHNANREVDTLLKTHGHLLAGGQFTSINGSSAHRAFASLKLTNGAPDNYLNLSISGHYHYCNSSGKCTVGFPTQVYNQQLSHSGSLDLAEGVFTKVGGKARQQIFMLNLATNPATVTNWTSPEWDGSNSSYPYQCWFSEPFYIRAAAWSPNDSTVYLATTGYHPWNLPTTGTRTGLCDSVAAFPATQQSVTHDWINYTGCDSLYAAAADNGAVYVAGHPRWADNPNGCNVAGPGAVADPGLQGHLPATGQVIVKSDGKALYTMSRANADDMLITSAGLWIASTNRYGSNFCDGVSGHAGICFLPY